jgi:peptidoglycan/xylan/chitin deacetylase (PgdA/CDA1 family)
MRHTSAAGAAIAGMLVITLLGLPAAATEQGVIAPPGTGAPDTPPPPPSVDAQAAAAPCSRGDVALTFDDGPHRVHTRAVLDALAKHDAPSTFFVVGHAVAAYPELVKATYAGGHVIANHTWAHEYLASLSDAGIRSTVRRTNDAVTRLGIPRPTLVRPPGGATSARARQVIESMGMHQVMWTVDPQDWRTGRSATEIANRVLAGLHDGANVVMHDGVGNSGATARALPRIITEGRNRGYCFGTLDTRGRVTRPAPTMRISSTSVTEGRAGTTSTAELLVTLDLPSRTPVSVDFATADGTAVAPYDYRPRSGTLLFSPGQVRKRIVLTVNGDDFHQADHWFAVKLTKVTGATLAGGGGRVVITDDDPPCPPARPGTLPRLAGGDRIETAVVISRASYAEGQAGAVVLARDRDYADALAGTPLAVGRQAPLLLSGTAALDARSAAELQRVLPPGGTVFLLGGTAALAEAVEQQVADLGFDPIRLGGANRYETAVLIAERGLDSPRSVLLATGRDFPDALSAGAAAPQVGGAVLLTHGRTMAPETAAYLRRHGVSTVYAVGGAAAAAAPAARALAGSDRYATARKVAETFFASPATFGLTSGETFADALGGGVHAGMAGGPLLLTRRTALPVAIADYLSRLDADGFLYGGTGSVAEPVRACAAGLR